MDTFIIIVLGEILKSWVKVLISIFIFSIIVFVVIFRIRFYPADDFAVPNCMISEFGSIDKSNRGVVLVHGFCRDYTNMDFLAMRLRKLGYNVLVPDLPTYFGTYQECLDSFAQQIEPFIESYERVNFIGHSMGGLLIRDYLEKHSVENLESCLFISTPFKGSHLADISKERFYYFWYDDIYKSISRLYTDACEQYSSSYVSKKPYVIGELAGDLNVHIVWRFVMPLDSDGKVTLDSAFTDDADERLILHYGHKFIHRNILAFRLVVNFLEYKSFRYEDDFNDNFSYNDLKQGAM